MQGQKSIFNPFPEPVDLNQGSVSNNTSMDQSNDWNTLTPMERRLLDYDLSAATDFSILDAYAEEARSHSGWDVGESSSGVNFQDQVAKDGSKLEHGWSSSFSARSGPDAILEERPFEPSNVLLRDSFNSGLDGNQFTGGPSSMQSSGSNHTPMNVNLTSGYAGNSNDGGQGMGGAVCTSLYKSESEASASSAGIGTSFGNSGYMMEDDIGSGSSLGNWGLSCKRKALEGTSGQSFPGGSSSYFPPAENIVRHTVPVRYNASSSLSISSPSVNHPPANHPEQLNPRIGVGMRGVAASDMFPILSVPGAAESSQRHFGVRMDIGHQEAVPFNLFENAARRSSACSSHQSSRPLSLNDFLDSRPAASVSTNSSNQPSQPPLNYVTGLPRNMPPFPWNGTISLRAGSSSSSAAIPGERGTEANFRSTLRNNMQHPNFGPATETRNLVQDPTNWSLATGSTGTNEGVPSSSRNSSSSGSRPFPNVWIPHHSPATQGQQRSSEYSPWTLFPSAEAESGGQRGHLSPFPSGSSSSSEETLISSGTNSQGHNQSYPRSALLMEVPGDDWRALAADIEGRQRLVSEIRQVLNAMRRGDNLRAEDYMLFDPIINGVAEFHDRHRDMRLDVDNMSYEELLALEERIGNVNTGLSEEAILKSMKQRKQIAFMAISPPNLEPCSICQEEFVTGDDIGTLDCGHDFHTHCIKQWLTQKNVCPICKMTALNN